MLIDFIIENWLYLAIVGGVIFVMTMIYVIYNLSSRSHMKKYDSLHADSIGSGQEVRGISLQDLIDQEIISTYESKNNKSETQKDKSQTTISEKEAVKAKIEPLIEAEISKKIISFPNEEDDEPVKDTANDPAAGAFTAKPEKKIDNPNSAPKKEIKKNTVKSENKPKEQKKELGRYHVLFRREDRKWFVKREGSNKILRILETQREAIAFATIKAITQNTSFVIHKQDGIIRKQS